MTITVLTSLFTISARRPIAIARLLLIIAIITAVTVGRILRAWFFYFLILVFLGGVIVVVLFMVSVCSNKKLIVDYNFNFSVAFLMVLLLSRIPKLLMNSNYSYCNIILCLYKSETIIIFFCLIIILVLCMIRVISISKLESGPLVKRL